MKYSADIKNIVDSILLEIPVVTQGKMFGYPAYYVNGKLFACVYEDGIGIKVPENTAVELIGKPEIGFFQPLGRPKMKEWIQINRENPDDYRKDMEIFNTSIRFVASLKSK
jgi:hypothetical protein